MWHTNNPNSRLSIYEIVELFAKSFLHISTMEKAIKWFHVTGIYSFDFDPAGVTNVDIEDTVELEEPAEIPEETPSTKNNDVQSSCTYSTTPFQDFLSKVPIQNHIFYLNTLPIN